MLRFSALFISVCLSIASGVVDVSLGFRGRVVRHIASSIMHIGFSGRGSINSNIACEDFPKA